MSRVSLDDVAQTPARTIKLEGTDELFEADPMPNAHGDREATLEDEHAKSVEDENQPIGEDKPSRPEKVVNEEDPVDQL